MPIAFNNLAVASESSSVSSEYLNLPYSIMKVNSMEFERLDLIF
jgi:hypothetical protein